MKKTIDYILIIIAIVGGLYFVFTRDREVGLILKDLSIVITITLPYILEKIFKIKINDNTKLIYIAFIFMAHFLGVIVELYNKIYYYDKVIHFISGIISSLGAIILLVMTKNYKEKNIFFNITYIIGIAMLVASCWEVFEYIANIFVGGDAQRVALTGVNDTMQDIIVALLGSIIISMMYWYEEASNTKLIIRKFIDSI